MLTLALSLGVGAVVTALFTLLLGKVVYGIIPGILAMGVVIVLVVRRVGADLQRRANEVGELLQPKNPTQQFKPAEAKRRIERAIAILEGGMKWQAWNPLTRGQIYGQIGTLHFVRQDYGKAKHFLADSSPRNWMAMAMLAAIHFRDGDDDAMKTSFEAAVKHNARESLAWNAYAWCLHQRDDRDGAIAVLNRASEHVGTDERTQRNLKGLQNGRKPRMNGWGMQWYQLGLEPPPQMNSPLQPRFSRRALKGR